PSGIHAFEYYDDAGSLAAGTGVAVTAGETTPDINAQLGLAGQIAGTVTDDADGSPLQYVWVTAYRQNGRVWEPVPTPGVETGPDGTYVLGGLVTGTYRVEFFNGRAGYTTEYYDNRT